MSLTIPMLFALVAIMGLGIVDSYFISYLGTNELAAIGFIVPITSVVQGLGLGLGMALSSLTSRLIGEQRTSSAARLITDGFCLTILTSVLAVGMLIWQSDNIFSIIGANQQVQPFISEYMQMWLFAVPMLMLTLICSSTFRALGDTKTSAQIAIWMTLINMVLDPLLIFGVGPFPELGMQGAALATVLSVLISTAIGLYQLGIKERLLIWEIPIWASFKNNLKSLLDIAIPAVLANSIIPITAAVLTTFVASYGTDAVAGFGVGLRLESVSLIIIYAMSSTLPMFIGQNLGAGKLDRVYEAIQIAFRATLVIQLIIYLLLLVLADLIAAQFSDQQIVRETITTFIWIVPLSYGLSGVVVLVNVSMNVLGKPKLALYINLIRLFVLYAPLSFLGSQLFGLKGLFTGVALSNCCIYVLATFMLRKTLRELDFIQA